MKLLFSPLFAKIFGAAAVLLLIIAGVQTIRVEHLKKVVAVLRIDLTKAKARTEAEIAKHEATKKAYREAQAEAERLEKQRLARVTAQQQEITDDRLQSLNSRLARARADAERLRRKARSGALGAPGGQPVPGLPDAAGRADEAAGDHRLSTDERLTATTQAIQLDELIGWIEKQANVNPN